VSASVCPRLCVRVFARLKETLEAQASKRMPKNAFVAI